MTSTRLPALSQTHPSTPLSPLPPSTLHPQTNTPERFVDEIKPNPKETLLSEYYCSNPFTSKIAKFKNKTFHFTT